MAHFADIFADHLRDHGVRYAFGIPGGPWIPYMKTLRRREMRSILVANETSAGFMADVCFRLTDGHTPTTGAAAALLKDPIQARCFQANGRPKEKRHASDHDTI